MINSLLEETSQGMPASVYLMLMVLTGRRERKQRELIQISLQKQMKTGWCHSGILSLLGEVQSVLQEETCHFCC